MNLAASLAAHGRTLKGPRCTVCHLLSDLDDGNAKVLRDALADPNYTHNGIARALRAEGYQVGASTISRHRKGECVGESR